MTRLFNDPADFADEALAGFCDAHSALVRQVSGGVVRRTRSASPRVAVLAGGGSGHYPAFAGIVGAGFATGAVVGNIFTSPSAQQAYSVAKAADAGAGVVFTYGNYAGDVMNFGMASERLAAEGISVENVIVTDDIASASVDEIEKRRGIAGDFTVFKVMGAAAEAGESLAEVVRLGRKANANTRTIGTAFQGCTFPGADDRLFSLEKGSMALGLGIHGEPGLHDTAMPTAAELGTELVQRVLAETPEGASTRIAVLLNGLGSSKLEELFVLWRTVAALLREVGYTLVAPEVGELVTSLDMAGVSLTVTWLDDELERMWLAPAETPAFRRGSIASTTGPAAAESETIAAVVALAASTQESRDFAENCLAALGVVRATLHDAESMLGDLDAIAGDGDHGRGMVRGIDAAYAAAADAVQHGAGAESTLAAAGDAWGDRAGGTSGVLWGAGLRALGETFGNAERASAAQIGVGVNAFSARLIELGKAEPGDKTMMDAIVPFATTLNERIHDGDSLTDAWIAAAAVATQAAKDTASLVPKKGRARPLADKSLGTPDPGATSMGLIVTAIGHHLIHSSTQEEHS